MALKSVDFVDILNICIHPQYQHQGLGEKLLQNLLQGLDKNQHPFVLLEVRNSNKTAISFYLKLGFELIDQRKKYYSNGEDAKILRFIL